MIIECFTPLWNAKDFIYYFVLYVVVSLVLFCIFQSDQFSINCSLLLFYSLAA